MDSTRRRHEQPSRLRQLRERAGYSARQAARAVGVSRRELAAYEDGRRAAPVDVRRSLAELYDVPAGALVPKRQLSQVVVEGPAVRIGRTSRLLDAYNPHADEVLDGYVVLVNKLRGLKPGEPFPLREADVTRLAEALGRDAETVERRLMELVHCSREEAQRIRGVLNRRRVLWPAAGMAMSAALIGIPRIDPEAVIEQRDPTTVQYKGLTLGPPVLAEPGPVDSLGLPLTGDPAPASSGDQAALPGTDPHDGASAASSGAERTPVAGGATTDRTDASGGSATTGHTPAEPGPGSGPDSTASGDESPPPASEEPPAEEPPAEQPAAEEPPAEDPPAEEPPAEDPPADDPPDDGRWLLTF